MQTRRDFLKTLALTVPASTCFSAVHGYAQPGLPATERFLFGADVYPDIQSPEQNKSMLDLLQSAHMNIVRVGDANSGNLELAPGQFNFGWLGIFSTICISARSPLLWEPRRSFRRSGLWALIRRRWSCSNQAPGHPIR